MDNVKSITLELRRLQRLRRSIESTEGKLNSYSRARFRLEELGLMERLVAARTRVIRQDIRDMWGL